MPRRNPASRPSPGRKPAGLSNGYIVEYLASERCPECGNAVNTVPQRTAPAFVLLLCLTLANAGMAVTAYWEYPKTLSAWRGTNKPALNAYWDAASWTAGFLLCGWILLAVSNWHRCRHWTLWLGLAISATHVALTRVFALGY
jgi:hypothetical protein